MNSTQQLGSRVKWGILAGCMLVIMWTNITKTNTALAQPSSLPDCIGDQGYDITPSYFFAADRTLFLIPLRGITVWRSSDDAASWTQVYNFSDPWFEYIQDLTIAPLHSEGELILYLQYTYGSPPDRPRVLLRSSDSGDTWEARTVPCPGCIDRSLRATNQPDVLFIARFDYAPYFGYPKGVARSEDGGLTWEAVWDEASAWGVTPSPDFANDQTVFAWLWSPEPVSNSLIIASNDGGSTWEGRGQGLCNTWAYDLTFSPDFANDQTVFVTMSGAIFRSQDAGLSWQPIYPLDESPCEDRYETGAVNVRPSPDYASDRTIFMNTPGALWVSYDDGRNWQVLARSNAQIIDFSVRRRPAPTGAPPAASVPVDHYLTISVPFTYQVYLPAVAAYASPVYQTYLPLLLAQEPLLHSLPLTLFVTTSGSDHQHYRSDDGGLTWACLNLPPASP